MFVFLNQKKSIIIMYRPFCKSIFWQWHRIIESWGDRKITYNGSRPKPAIQKNIPTDGNVENADKQLLIPCCCVNRKNWKYQNDFEPVTIGIRGGWVLSA